MAESEIDGVLVGGASLDPESFAKIVRIGSTAVQHHARGDTARAFH
jgi:triosephosphate isomerase